MSKKSIFIIGMIVCSILYLCLRLVGYEEKITYHLDQGLHLMESREMWESQKIRLIGPMVSSKTFMDKGFFIGPYYYYILTALGLIFNWNPLNISLFLMIIEFAFIVYFVNWLKIKFGVIEALTVFGIMATSSYLIIHSRFIWNPHFLLPLGILAAISLSNYFKSHQIRYLFLFSLIWGIAFSFHYSAILAAIPLLFIFIKQKIFFKKEILFIPIFFIIGNTPYILFEIRHNFYNIKTLFWVMTNSVSSSKLEPHYLIYPFIIFFLIFIAWLINKIKSNKFKIATGTTILTLLFLVQFISIHDYIPLGHPTGWTYPLQLSAVNEILKNGCPQNYNIASTISGDTRSYDLRFLLISKGCKPMNVEQYPDAEKLYLVARSDRPPETETVWEVKSLGKINIIKKTELGPNLFLYEIIKNTSTPLVQ